jgi:hypothetical protein
MFCLTQSYFLNCRFPVINLKLNKIGSMARWDYSIAFGELLEQILTV